MAIFDLGTALLDLEGSFVREGEKVVTLGLALKRAVLSDVDELGNALKADAKLARYELFLKLKRAETEVVDWTAEEIAALKSAVTVFPTLVMGQIRDLLKI